MLHHKEEYEFTPEGVTEINGRPLIAARFRESRYNTEYRFWFDPAQGYLPVQIYNHQDPKHKIPPFQIFVTDARECSRQRWFPQRIVWAHGPMPKTGHFEVRELTILELDADSRPSRDLFAFDIPGGVEVIDSDTDKFFTLKQQEKITLDELPTLIKMCEQASKQRLMDTAVPRSPVPDWLRWAGGIGGALLAVGGLGFVIWRFKRRGSILAKP